ncbi:ribulose phosphate epimerase [Pseudenhygromyxa sp. WMMC2535]|uniref:ribulose phosphate epimerase n=1 Tax=Pseudenhygromyxa sp. WMMC2535 TaxID=2712867 RepID=UPI0020D1E8A4|nr:ribulose phosphate epimerase [Pseudenhygromyxa sp. WMMC2535]
MSLTLTGCPKDDQSADTETTTTTQGDGTDDDAGESTGEEGEEGTTSTTTDDDTTEDEGTTFLNVDMPSVAECDPWAQDCPDGEKCVPYANDGGNSWNANKCVTILGDGSIGDECTWDGIIEATDTCGTDSVCWDAQDVDGVAVGVCTAFCDGSPDDPSCDVGTSCLIANDGSITLCIQNCDPLLQDCEASGLACYWAVDSFQCIATSQGLQLNEECGYINDCDEGMVCLDASVLPNCAGSACCAGYCDIDDPQCLDGDTECVTFWEEGEELPGYENVGICILPG